MPKKSIHREGYGSGQEEEDNKREYRPRRKKRIPKLPNECIVIKNKDKDVGNWSETWGVPKKRSPACLPHSFRLLALGAPGRGKTNYMKQLFLAHQSTAKKFKKVYIITCDVSSQEWDDIEPTGVYDRLPELENFDGKEKTCLVIDDYEFQNCGSDEIRKLTTLFRHISTHKNVSIMASYQSFFHTPQICRKTANCFILYRPTSDNELQTISNRVGIKYKDLRAMFKQYCTNYYDMIMIDLSKDSPYRIRYNIYDTIDYDSDSD